MTVSFRKPSSTIPYKPKIYRIGKTHWYKSNFQDKKSVNNKNISRTFHYIILHFHTQKQAFVVSG